MPPQEFAFAAPGTEEMTKTAVSLGGAAVAGVVEGVVVKMAPQLGALEVPFTWATLLGIPAVGIAGALYTRGMISDVLQGVAAGGAAVAGYVLPAMLLPEGLFGRKTLTAEQRQALAAGRDIKQLGEGPLGAARRAQEAAARAARGGSSLEF